MIPDLELDLLINSIDRAVALAVMHRVADGYCELEHGLERAQAARDDGEEWADLLVTRYRIALDNFCESYGPRMEEVP